MSWSPWLKQRDENSWSWVVIEVVPFPDTPSRLLRFAFECERLETRP